MFAIFRPIPFVLALVGGLAGPLAAQDAAQPILTVTGTGQADAKPDLAFVSVGVSETSDSADAALDAMSRAAQQILGDLAAAGIAEADIQTGQLSLDPVYGNPDPAGNATVTGFMATTLYDVRVRQISTLGDVLDTIVGGGANRLAGVRFDVVDPLPLQDTARRQAVMAARHSAEVLATAAGVTLGSLVRLDEQSNGGGAPLYRMAAEAMSVPIAGGTVSQQSTVTMVFAIIN